MKLPFHIIPYVKGILWDNKVTTTHMSKLVKKSHDFLTRSLKIKVQWKRLFLQSLANIDLSKGYLVIDESEESSFYTKEYLKLLIFHHNRILKFLHI